MSTLRLKAISLFIGSMLGSMVSEAGLVRSYEVLSPPAYDEELLFEGYNGHEFTYSHQTFTTLDVEFSFFDELSDTVVKSFLSTRLPERVEINDIPMFVEYFVSSYTTTPWYSRRQENQAAGVPEPFAVLLVGIGVLALGILRWKLDETH